MTGPPIRRTMHVGAAESEFEREADAVPHGVLGLLPRGRDGGVGGPATAGSRTPIGKVRRSLGAREYGLSGASADPWPTAVSPLKRVSPQSVVVQRKISQQEWDEKIVANLTDGVKTGVQEDAGVKRRLYLRQHGGNVEWAENTNGPWTIIDNVPAFCAGHTWLGKHVNRQPGPQVDPVNDVIDFRSPAGLVSKIKPTDQNVNMDVQSIPGDEHSIVHESYNIYKPTTGKGKKAKTERLEADHHLTVENAHVLLMLTLKDNKTAAGLNKTTMEKPEIDAKITGGWNTHGVDNLNFYPEVGKQVSRPLRLSKTVVSDAQLSNTNEPPGATQLDQRLSLQEYLTFIQTALQTLEDEGVPPVYGAKILQTAQDMKRLTNWDPEEMFLRVGKGDQRHLVRAVLTIATHGLAPGLVIPPATLQVFSRYLEPKPHLPISEPVVATTEFIAEAALSNDGKVHYNTIEPKYVDAHVGGVMDAIKAYIA